jgi:hypothetical protein
MAVALRRALRLLTRTQRAALSVPAAPPAPVQATAAVSSVHLRGLATGARASDVHGTTAAAAGSGGDCDDSVRGAARAAESRSAAEIVEQWSAAAQRGDLPALEPLAAELFVRRGAEGARCAPRLTRADLPADNVRADEDLLSAGLIAASLPVDVRSLTPVRRCTRASEWERAPWQTAKRARTLRGQDMLRMLLDRLEWLLFDRRILASPVDAGTSLAELLRTAGQQKATAGTPPFASPAVANGFALPAACSR